MWPMYRLSLLLCFYLTITSCERLLLPKEPDDDPLTNFESMWETIDKKYSFFDYKNINWDSIYAVYRPRVQQGMTNRELYNVLSEMLYVLRDGHVNLITPFDLSRNWTWYLNAPQNFNFTNIERNYLSDRYEISGPLINDFIADSIGYIYYSSFGRSIGASQLDYVLRKFADTKGILFDVRDNGGGSLSNVTLLLSRFADQRRLAVYNIYKTGPGHSDFSAPFPVYIEPEVEEPFTKPIIILTNRSSYSATNDFVAQMKALPNVTVLGDTTGGGGGLPYYAELPNGWRYRFSSTQTWLPDSFNIENGIPPDVRVDLLPLDEFRGDDTLIEEAIDLLP